MPNNSRTQSKAKTDSSSSSGSSETKQKWSQKQDAASSGKQPNSNSANSRRKPKVKQYQTDSAASSSSKSNRKENIPNASDSNNGNTPAFRGPKVDQQQLARMKYVGALDLVNHHAQEVKTIQELTKKILEVFPSVTEDKAVQLLQTYDWDYNEVVNAITENREDDWNMVQDRRSKQEQKKQQADENKRKLSIKCFNCGEWGHPKSKCTKPPNQDLQARNYEQFKQKRSGSNGTAPSSAPSSSKSASHPSTTPHNHSTTVTAQPHTHPSSTGRSSDATVPLEESPLDSTPTQEEMENLRKQEQIERGAVCRVCDELYSDPRLLSCLHSVCLRCIPQLVRSSMPDYVHCPVCKCPTEVANQDYQTLPQNHALAAAVAAEQAVDQLCENCEHQASTCYCYSCSAFLCDNCNASIHKQKVMRNHRTVPAHEKKQFQRTCQDHQGERLTLYCVPCNQVVCSHCLLVGNHRSHQCSGLKDVARVTESRLFDHIDAVTHKQAGLEELRATIDGTSKTIVDSYDRASATIRDQFQYLHRLLEQRESELQNEALYVKQKKVEQLKNKGDELSEYIFMVNEAWTTAQRLVKMCDEVELMDIHAVIASRLNMVTGLSTSIPVFATQEVSVQFDSGAVQTSIAHYGRINRTEG